MASAHNGEYLIKVIDPIVFNKKRRGKSEISVRLIACNMPASIDCVIIHGPIKSFRRQIIEHIPVSELPLFFTWPTRTDEFYKLIKGE
jgi:hypothetical protein